MMYSIKTRPGSAVKIANNAAGAAQAQQIELLARLSCIEHQRVSGSDWGSQTCLAATEQNQHGGEIDLRPLYNRRSSSIGAVNHPELHHLNS